MDVFITHLSFFIYFFHLSSAKCCLCIQLVVDLSLRAGQVAHSGFIGAFLLKKWSFRDPPAGNNENVTETCSSFCKIPLNWENCRTFWAPSGPSSVNYLILGFLKDRKWMHQWHERGGGILHTHQSSNLVFRIWMIFEADVSLIARPGLQFLNQNFTFRVCCLCSENSSSLAIL